MSFKYSAFTENTHEMREWMEGIGIRPKIELAAHCQDELIIARNGYYIELPESLVLLYESDAIDCRNNPDLFQAVTAMREDSDYMQWFITTKGKWVLSKYHKKKQWSKYSTGWKQTCRKATLTELQEHFKKK